MTTTPPGSSDAGSIPESQQSNPVTPETSSGKSGKPFSTENDITTSPSCKPTTLTRVRALTGKGEWSEVDKIRAVAIYLQVGMLTKTSEMTGVPVETLRNWKISPWWYEVKNKILAEQDDEISTRFTKIVKKAQKQVLDRLENGDWVITKMGEKKRIEMKGKDAQYILNSAIDKRQLLNDRPTARVETLTMKDKLAKIGQEFEKFAKARQINVPKDEE